MNHRGTGPAKPAQAKAAEAVPVFALEAMASESLWVPRFRGESSPLFGPLLYRFYGLSWSLFFSRRKGRAKPCQVSSPACSGLWEWLKVVAASLSSAV